MIRYQIRNEYGLSDPELYSAPGEEDDPEALLEGVAMAGLVGVLRQLGDLAEFAAEIFHDLHEDVMATASRGHGLMLRLQQLEAEFPAVEKAIISQTDHSNYPHDEGVEWHANLQLKQNMITQGDMPRFILDSYEECRGPPQLFTLDKFDVAGTGASLKRYSDPSFFKTEYASNMIEPDVVIEKKPRRIKKKAMRWRKGVTLESLLVANSESQSTTKDRASRKVPPRTTKLKSRHPRSPDHKTISKICREHLLEVILSQQKIMSGYSARHYHVKFRSTDSSRTTSPLGESNNYGTLVESSGKLDLTKVVPLNESDNLETTSATTNGSAFREVVDKQFLRKQHGPNELKEVCKMSPVEPNGMIYDSEKLQDCPDLLVGESNRRLQSAHEGRLLLAAVPADQDADGCRSDDIASDHDSFVDAPNNMDSEGDTDPEMKTELDPNANVEGNGLNCGSKEGKNALDAQFLEVGPARDSSPGLNGSYNGEEPTCVDLPLINDSAPSTVASTNGPNSGSPSARQMNAADWTNDKEPFDDNEDLMDVSSSSSLISDDADLPTIDDCMGRQQYRDEASYSLNAAIIQSSDKHSPKTSSGLDGLASSSNDCTEKAYHSVDHCQNLVQDGTSMVLGKPDVSEGKQEINVGIADESFLHPTKAKQEEMQEPITEMEEAKFVDTGASPDSLAIVPAKDHAMLMNDPDIDNVADHEKIVPDRTSALQDPYDIHEHLDGIAATQLNMRNNLLYESHDDEIVEDVRPLQDDGLSIPLDNHVAEDNRIIVLEERTCSAPDTQKEDSVQSSAMARDFSYIQELPGAIQGVSPSQDQAEVYEGATLAPPSCVFNDDIEPLNSGMHLAPSTSSLPETTNPCVEQHELTEMEDTVESVKVVVTQESTASRFADDVVPPEEEVTDDAKYSEKAEVLATEEDSRHDVQLQSSSPSREVSEAVETTCRNLGALDESRELISKKRMSQTDNSHSLVEIETTGEKCSGNDPIHFVSTAHFPEESDYEEELLDEASLNAEVLSRCNSDKDGSVSLKNNVVEKHPLDVDPDFAWGVTTQDSRSNTVEKQPADADLDLAWDLSAQDSSSTNPFMDPAYMTSHAQIYPSPSMSYQPCFSDEQDFLSELLTEHEDTRAAADSLWEPATPPDEAPLPSEVMNEEDFRSFCHEYHEIDFTAGAEGCHGEPGLGSNNFSNACVVNESDFASSVSALQVKLDQEACVGSKFGSQHAECSSAMDIHANTSMPFSATEDLEDEAPGVDSRLKSHDSFSDSTNPELDMLSIPVAVQQGLSGADSHSSSRLLDKEKMSDEFHSPSNIVAEKKELEIRANLVPHSFMDENVDELDVPLRNDAPVEPEVGAHVLDEHSNKDAPNDLPSSVDENKDNPEVSGDNASRIALSSSLNDKIDGLDGPPSSNAIALHQEPEVSVPCGLDSRISPCPSTDEKLYGLDCATYSSSGFVDLESEDHVLDDGDSQDTPCSLVKDMIDQSEASQPNSVLSEELEQNAHASPELDSHVAPCFNNVGQIDGSLLCNVQVESDCPTEDSQTAPCSSNSDLLADTTASTCTPVMPSTQYTHQLPRGPPLTVPFQNDSYEDPQKSLPLPPLQWRLGRPRLGLLGTKGYMPGSASRTDPILQASSQEMDPGPVLPDQTDRSVEPGSPQGIKNDTDKNSMMDDNDQNVEFGKLSASVAETDVARPSSGASENIKQQEHMSSSALGVEEHLDDTGVMSKTGVEEHLDDSGVTSKTGVEEHLNDFGVTHGTDLCSKNPLLPLPTNKQQGPQLCVLSSYTSENSEHPATKDNKSMDDQNTAGDTVSTSTDKCYQQAQHGESFSENLDCKAHISNASEDDRVKYQTIMSEAPSDTANHSAPDSLLEEGSSQKNPTLQEQNVEGSENGQLGGSLPSPQSVATQDYPNGHNLERGKINQPSGPGPFVIGLDEGSYVHAEQPPVMGWTVGPQMLHPKYGISVEERSFEPNITENHLIRKPISIRNIPRNPLVDAVAAHDRSSMRKVSELAPPTDKPNPDERNLLLEQIRNKTFNLKPASSPVPTSIRSPARANTRNLKVAAIIEKANAIRQAVGSDEEDEDNWSD